MQEKLHRHTTIGLPRQLDRWLRIRAAERDTSKSELMRENLTKAVNQQSNMAQEEAQQETRDV